jgi:hypothetical protein
MRWRMVPAPSCRNTSFRIGPVLTLVAMRLAGRREIPEIVRFATIPLAGPEPRAVPVAQGRDVGLLIGARL